GTILGMKKKEIDKKFDEIVYFSDVEKFIDTQVKKYSSGMRIRLAFAVAANIQTEIMIIDEVLSIGDADFQKKSVAKMIQIAKQGTAVILVTHNMAPIQAMCSRSLLIENGRLIGEGKTDDIIAQYLGQASIDQTSQNWKLEEAPRTDFIKFTKAGVHPLNNNFSVIRPGDPFEFEFEFHILFEDEKSINITFHLNDEYENLIFVGSTAMTNREYKTGKGFVKANCRIPENLLNSGKYTISKFFIVEGISKVLYEHDDLLTFEITNSLLDKHDRAGTIDGLLKPKLDWEVFMPDFVEI
ncbi:MAG: ABC transporter ATP-binding protein, partial [bacterium]